MRNNRVILFVAVVAVFCGCIPSLHPLYTDEDLIFDEALIGRWTDEDEASWEFSKVNEKKYELIHTDGEGNKGEFKAHLAKIGGEMFLDLYPDDLDCDVNHLMSVSILPAHIFLHVKQIEPTLQMRFLNPEWMEEYVKENPDAIAHEELKDVPGNMVLTAKPKELQAFLIAHLETEKAYTDFIDMKKVVIPPAE